MKIKFFQKLSLVILCIATYQIGTSQNVGINATGISAHASSMLDVSSTNKGLLIPRIALTGANDVATIPSPATSLLIYNTATVLGVNAINPGYYSWSGTAWVRESSYNTKNWSLTGNALTDPTINFIGTTDAIDFVENTNGVERLRITSSGAVNIWSGSKYATSNNFMPSGSLTLGNTLANFGGGSNWNANTAGLLMECLDNAEIAVHDAGTRLASLLYFEGATTNRIQIGRDMAWGSISTIALSGNVGIGTTTPGYKLDVTDRMRIRQAFGSAGSVSSAGMWFYQTSGADRAFLGMYDDNSLAIYSYGAGWSGLNENVNTGNVGINVFNPTFKLQVNDPNPLGGFQIQGGTTTDGAVLSIVNANNYGYDINNTAYNNGLGIYDLYAGAFRLNILSNGNVGFGINTPTYILDVAGKMRLRQRAGSTGASDGAGIWFYQNTPNSDRAFLGMYDDNNIGIFGNGGAGWGGLTMSKHAHVGIGIIDPLYYFQVRASSQQVAIFNNNTTGAYIQVLNGAVDGLNLWGNSSASGGANIGNSNGNAWAPCEAYTYVVISDKNIKHDIHDIVSSEYEKYINQIRAIESATYKYNFETYRTKNHIGVIAQTLPIELQAQMTETPDPQSKPIAGLSLADMAGLNLVGIKAIDYNQSELQKLMLAQQKIINELKLEIEQLENQK